MTEGQRTRKRWPIALTAILVLLLGAAIVYPIITGDDEHEPSQPPASPTPTDDIPWDETYIPGYDPDPGPFEITPVPADSDTTITASLAFDDSAVETDNVIGLSFDAEELASEAWGSPESNLALTLQELDRPVLRFGGNGVDRRMWWTSDDEPAPDWAEFTVTPDDLERVAGVADDVDAQVTIALDLGNDDAERAADMASHAQQAFGDRLMAVAVGNEPNGYHHPNQPQLTLRDEDWGPDAYRESLIEYAEAIDEAAPGLPIAGPGAYDAPWWRAFAEADLPQTEALSMHWYPLWDCEGPDDSIANPTVEDLTSPAIRERAYEMFDMAGEVATEHGLPLWMEETGPTSCPGTNDTSRTHAQALWTVDFALTAMDSGIERLAFHSTLHACEGGAPMSSICALGDYDDPGLIMGGRTSYLSMMMLGWLPDGHVLSPTVSGDGTVMVHGALGDDGTLAVVIVDLRDPAEDDSITAVDLSAPTGLADDATDEWQLSEGAMLSGTALDAQESELGALAPVTGEFEGAALSADEQLTLPSEPGSVTLLTFSPDSVE